MVTADRAVRIAADLHLTKLHGKGIHEEEPPGQGFSNPKKELHCLYALDASNDPAEHPQDPSLLAARDQARGRGRGK